MKRIFRKKWFWVTAVIVVIIIVIIVSVASGEEKAEYTTQIAEIGKLTQTVTATGAVDSANDIDLAFKSGGRVSYMAVDEGVEVRAGQLLAAVDASSVSAQVAQYRASLTAAQADLDQVRAGSSVEQVRISEERLSKARADLDSLKNKRNNELQTLREKSINTLNNASFTMDVGLDKVFNHLIAKDKTVYLQVSNSDLKDIVNSEYYAMQVMVNRAQDYIDQANDNKISDVILDSSTKVVLTMNDLGAFLEGSFSLADKIIVNANYSQATKDSIKTDISTQQSTNNTTLTTVQTAKSNLLSTIDNYNSQIQAAENSLSIAQAELNLTTADPREFEVSAYEARVAQARAQLNSALASLSDHSIFAPIDGIVTKVNYNLGEQAVASQTVIQMLSTDRYEINVNIPESDITKIKVGDETIIELDAFGPDHFFIGTVTFIDPAQTVIQDVIYYRTKVSIDSDSIAEQIKPGMTADVTITTIESDNVLYIPQRAVKIREAVLGEVPEKYVEVLVGENQVEEKSVEIGVRGDGGLVEILSGLQEGDVVITFKKNNK